MSRLRAARHELRCRECRVTWGSWLGRLLGMRSAYSPGLSVARRRALPCGCIVYGRAGCPAHRGCTRGCNGTWPHYPGEVGRAFHVRDCELA